LYSQYLYLCTTVRSTCTVSTCICVKLLGARVQSEVVVTYVALTLVQSALLSECLKYKH